MASSKAWNHAELILDRDGWTLIDHTSTNGTFVDGVRVRRPVRLINRQLVTFGDVGFVFLERFQ